MADDLSSIFRSLGQRLPPLAGPGTQRPADQADRQENQFQGWARGLPWYSEFQQQYGEAPNLDDPDYDYRAAFREGITPQRYAPDGGKYHWPSTTEGGQHLKSENHPTMWAEKFMQATGTDPFTIGIRDPEAAANFLQTRRR